MRKIIFFTQSYPFSNNYSWKRNELKELVKHFDVTVIPFIYSKSKLDDIPEGVKIHEPLLDYLVSIKTKFFFKVLSSPRRKLYLKEFFRKKVYTKKEWVFEWLGTSYRTEILLKHKLIEDLIKNEIAHKDTILYFYWGVGAATLVPFLSKYDFRKIVVRFHGFDLYEERRIGYIPFRRDLLANLDDAVYISEAGLNYAHKRYADVKFRSHLFKLGSKSATPTDHLPRDKFRMVSCSNIIPLKQVHQIARSLKFIPFELEWWHLGDGPDLELVKEICNELPPNIKVNLAGRISPDEVLEIYSTIHFDLFINFSLSEGLPVSIMEALSAGIPILATDVGGTAEIVDLNNGKLIKPDIQVEELASEIHYFYDLDDEQQLNYRKSAVSTYHEKCDFNKLTAEFINFLQSD